MNALAPEHLEDLRKSGLSDETIASCEFKAVPPNELRILKGIESAYEIPYFTRDNLRNCFVRWKLFYQSNFTGDRKQKYHQKRDSGVQVYLPPLIAWTKIAADPSRLLCVVEGEKKSLCLVQSGYLAIGLGGIWNHHDHDETGESLVVPALTMFNWKGRRVELVVDSDGWRPEKLLDVLGGMYAIGAWLAKQGAIVTFVRIPEPHGVKVGADDFIVGASHLWREQWNALERVPIDDRRLDVVAAKWQKRTAKQQAQEAFRDRTADDLVLNESVGLFTVRSAAHALTLEFDSLHTRGTGVIAELSVTVGGVELRSNIDVNLKSDSAQTALARNLHALIETLPWKVVIPRACAMVLKRFRQGAPILWVDEHTVAEPLTFVVTPLVMKGKPTVMFADGGKGKSTLALLTALLVTKGASVAGLSAIKGRALYCDWEDDENVFIRRHHAIQLAHPELRGDRAGYLGCTQPLARMTQELSRQIHREGITFLVIDSLVKAAGGGSDAEATEHLFAALRVLNVSTLIIAHTPKPTADGPSTASIYGSVFNSNFARATWEFQVEQEIGEDSSVIGLFQRKTNHTRKHHPIGLKVTHHEMGTSIRYEAHDLGDTAELEKSLPLASRIRNLLDSDGTPRTSKQISDELGVKLGTVKACLSKGKKHKWSLIGEHGDKEALWTTISS